MTKWVKLLRRDVEGQPVPPEFGELLDQMVQALQYACDAALDIASLLGRLSFSVVVMRRMLWLKCWSADQASKKALTELPFQGDGLFGATLDDIIKGATGVRVPFSCRLPGVGS